MDIFADRAARQRLIAKLAPMLGERLSENASVRESHGRDESYHPALPPDAVVWPETVAEIADILALCNADGVPVIPFGVGTSLEGGVGAPHGGVSVDLSRMNRIMRVSQPDMDVTVEAGVTRKQLNAHLRDTGLFFPIDPGADATIGGMAATRASGTNAVRYGTMRDNVLALTVVLADGRVIRTGRRARKSAAGYDLARLFIGSEGTLGVIAEVTLRLAGIPEAQSAAVCAFPTLCAAVDACIETIQSGVPVARVELMDEVAMGAVNAHAGLDYAAQPTLFYEFHGSPAGVREQAETAEAIAAARGGADFRWAARAEDRTRLWQARHDALYAALALRPGARAWSTDVCVPISQLAACIAETRIDLETSQMIAPILGHVGDGNFHVVMILDPANKAEMGAAEAFNDRLLNRALAMDGTITGEHGIGLGKRAALANEHGEALDIMRALKSALDPNGIMNPGKLFISR